VGRDEHRPDETKREKEDEALREAQEGKGYGAGEGEREAVLENGPEKETDAPSKEP
jgi:hypothetical protein